MRILISQLAAGEAMSFCHLRHNEHSLKPCSFSFNSYKIQQITEISQFHQQIRITQITWQKKFLPRYRL